MFEQNEVVFGGKSINFMHFSLITFVARSGLSRNKKAIVYASPTFCQTSIIVQSISSRHPDHLV